MASERRFSTELRAAEANRVAKAGDMEVEDAAEPTGAPEEEELEEGDEGEEEEEDEEPTLKYLRLGKTVAAIFENEDASCLAVHQKFLVLGTRRGQAYVLDVTGDNEITRLPLHTHAINELSLDVTGDVLATASEDGTVVVTDLFKQQEISRHSYHKPVKSVCLASNYKTSTMFAAGGNNHQLVINSKGWFASKDSVIHSQEGPVYAVAWKNDFIAWGNRKGVKVYDCSTSERIAFINCAPSQPDLHRCCLAWCPRAKEDTLLIGWGSGVTVAVIREKPPTVQISQQGGGPPVIKRFMQVTSKFEVDDCWICGIAPAGDNNVCILAYVKPEETEGGGKQAEEEWAAGPDDGEEMKPVTRDARKPTAHRPELRILSRHQDDISADALPIHAYQYYTAADYKLAYLDDNEPLYYVVSPKDILVGRPRDVDDHIAWLLSRQRYQEALSSAERNIKILKRHNVAKIGESYLHHLVKTEEFTKAASLCPKLLAGDPKMWETWIFTFAKLNQVKAIAPYIPVNSPTLPKAVYELVLNRFLVEDHGGFLKMIRTWSPSLYDLDTVITKAEEKLLETDREVGEVVVNINKGLNKLYAAPAVKKHKEDKLIEALGELYQLSKQYNKAVHMFLELQRKDLFDLVKRLDLWDSVRDKVLPLLTFDLEGALDLFVEHNNDKIPVDAIVSQLKDSPKMLHEYLHALFLKDNVIGAKYHERQVKLYADYAPHLLLNFLRNSTHYLLEDALQICKERNRYQEMVFISKRMGNLNYALGLIIEKLNNVHEAISFVEEHKDEALWEELISRSLQNPAFLSDLLDNVGSHYVDMLRLIRRIPNDMLIPGLRQKIQKIMSDQMLQVAVRSGCNTILAKDGIALQHKLHTRQQRALRVNPHAVKCPLCEGFVAGQGVIVFLCKHVYHIACLEAQRADKTSAPTCPRCNDRQQGPRSTKRLPKLPPTPSPPPAAGQAPAKQTKLPPSTSHMGPSLFGTAPAAAASAGSKKPKPTATIGGFF